MVLMRSEETDERTEQAPWPPNSIEYYRTLKGITLPELAESLGTKHPVVQRFEKSTRELTPQWAKRIGAALGGVSGEDIGYSSAPDAYYWATRGVPIVGTIVSGFRVELFDRPSEKTGGPSILSPQTAALTIAEDVVPLMRNMVVMFDHGKKMRVTANILASQGKGWIVYLKDGTVWWRQIQPGAKRNHYHINATGVTPILDAEVEGVSEIVGIYPIRPLPPT